MTTVGYGDISPNNTIEYIIAMSCMLFGSGIIGYSINSIGTILKKMNKKDDREAWGDPDDFFLPPLGYTSNLLEQKKTN